MLSAAEEGKPPSSLTLSAKASAAADAAADVEE